MHRDEHPSCDLDLVKNVWKCYACGNGGGKADLIIAASLASARSEAAAWLEERLGTGRPRVPRRNEAARTTLSRGAGHTWNGQAADLRRVLAIEAEDYRTRHSIEGELFVCEINAIRENVAQRYCIYLTPILPPLHEGGFGGRERDPAWRIIFEWALFVASIRLLGVPIAFDERLSPPPVVLLAAEDLAATAMRSIEHEARHAPADGAA
jgi:hypothetical protein